MTSYLPWVFSTGGRIRGKPLIAEASIYLGSDDGCLYAADLDSRRESWRFQTGGRIASAPVLHSGLLFFGSHDGIFYAVDSRTGAPAWRFDAGAHISASPALAQGLVMFGSLAGVLHALDESTGEERWRLQADGGIVHPPAVSGSSVCFTDGSGRLFAVDMASGETVFADEKPRASTGLMAFGDLVLFGSGLEMLALRLPSGEVAWRFPVHHRGISEPVLAGESVCFGEDHYLYCLDAASGMPKWELATGGAPAGAPAVSGHTLFVSTRQKGILAVDLDTGHLWWSFDAAIQEPAPAEVAAGWIFSGGADGKLYAYRLEDPPAEAAGEAQAPGRQQTPGRQPPRLAYHVRGRIYSNAQVPWHLFPLILLSATIFQYYWFFRNWRYMSVTGIRSLRPGWRLAGLLLPLLFPLSAGLAGGMTSAATGWELSGLFFDLLVGGTVACYVVSLFLMYDQFRTIRNVAREHGVRDFPLFIVVSAYFSLQNLPSFLANALAGRAQSPAPAELVRLAVVAGLSFTLSVFVLTVVQRTLNRIWEQHFPYIPVRRRFSAGEIVLMGVVGSALVVGIILLPLALLA